jgi:flavoprotein
MSKIADKVFKMLDAIMERIGEENFVQVMTNNAANYKAAGQLLMEKIKKLFWTPCATPCIDLILKDLEKKLEVHQVTIAKGRRVTSYIYSRTILISIPRHFTK